MYRESFDLDWSADRESFDSVNIILILFRLYISTSQPCFYLHYNDIDFD